MTKKQTLILPLLMTGTMLYSQTTLANTRPVAEKQSISVTEGSKDITLVGSDADGDTLSYKIIRKPRKGTLSKVSENQYTYTPKANFSGSDRFLFRVNDGTSSSRLATVKISVEADDNANANTLTAKELSVSTKENKRLRITLASTDNSRGLSFAISTQPQHGTLKLRRNRVSYQPEKDYNGSDSFQYTVSKGGSSSAPASVNIEISAVNSKPTAKDQTIDISKEVAQVITLQGADAEDTSPQYKIIRKPRQGSLVLQGGAEAFYTPKDGYTGADSFSYRVTDSEGLRSRVARVKLTIAEAGEPEPEKPNSQPTPTGKLNDTGIIQSHATGDDATTGRDVTANDNSDGHAGFSFLKIDTQGKALTADATSWNCVKDKVTGLVWEVKQGVPNNTIGDTGLHDPDDRYRWYNTDNTNNGGNAGNQGAGAYCLGFNEGVPSSYCNTKAYVDRVNAQGWCGASDWRLPNKDELSSIASLDRFNPAIDTDYFPNTKSSWYWSSSPVANNANGAWLVNFHYGYDHWNDKNYGNVQVRLVRSGQ